MAAFNKFETFVGDLGLAGHNLNTNTLAVYLSNAVPDAAADSVKADLAEIATGNGYAGPIDTLNTYAEAAGTGTLQGTSAAVVASGGAIATFRYVVLFNDTHASDALIGWWDNGSAVNLADGETFNVKFNNAAVGVAGTILTIA